MLEDKNTMGHRSRFDTANLVRRVRDNKDLLFLLADNLVVELQNKILIFNELLSTTFRSVTVLRGILLQSVNGFPV